MSSPIKCEVLIAGAGPAGLATALYLLRAHPELKGRVVAIEKARHPRPKTCAGGLIPKTMLALKELGLALEVPAIEVMRGTARTEVGEVEMFRGDPLCTVIRRDQFDARLARAAKAAGLEIIDECRVLEVEQSSGGSVRVRTERATLETPVLVGADGSGSRVRASVFDHGKDNIGRAMMIDLPVDPERTREFVEQRYVFDFKCVVAGISGYAWVFPCLIDNRPHLNVGIYDQHPPHSGSPDKSPLPDRLREAFPDLPLDGFEHRAMSFKAFPIRWFNPSHRFVNDRVMLAGDAAGVDPLMGEGISCAFEHGKLAARYIGELLGGDRAALSKYDAALHHGAVGKKLRKLAFAARHFYGPRHRLYFKLAGINGKAQAVGVDWYNGAGNLDELPVRALLGKWMRAVLFDSPLR
jgi:flavin-dependent dehydrogenase